MKENEVEDPNMTEQVRKTLIYTQVKQSLCDALNLEDEDVKPSSTLVGDLGAESIDFLDIVFRLERGFNMKIPQKELFPENVFDGDDACLDAAGKMTDHGIAKLQSAMPHVQLRNAEGHLTFDGTVAGVQEAFTVQSLVNFIYIKEKS
jgi:acyl carrier protein